MISVRCPECGSRLEVDDIHLGADVRCPACRAVFPANPLGAGPLRDREADVDRPRQPPEDDDDEYERPRRRRTRADVIADARREVYLPALLSVIACVLTICYHILDLVVVLANPGMLKNNPFLGGGGQGGFQWTPEMYAAARAFSITWQLVVIAGSFQMMRLGHRGFALTAMVLQVVPCGSGICCILGLGVGIWGLVVLSRPDVKDGFALARDQVERPPARDRDRGYDDEDDER